MVEAYAIKLRNETSLLLNLAYELFSTAAELAATGQSEEAILSYDEVVARFGNSDVGDLQEVVAFALFNKGIILGELKKPEDAVAAYNRGLILLGKSKK